MQVKQEDYGYGGCEAETDDFNLLQGFETQNTTHYFSVSSSLYYFLVALAVLS